MIRALRYVIIMGLLAAGAVWLANQSGALSLQWGRYQIDTSVGVMAAVLGFLAVVSGLTYRVWLFIRRAPDNFRQSWRGHRRGRGYQALTKGMVAVAAGDAEEAQRQARKADGLLGEPPLTMLLSAQAAQLGGDERAAERFFRAMTENRETEFLGLRGLLNQAMKRQNLDEAVSLARRAYRLKPDSEWVSQSLFELQVRTGKWLDASGTAREAARNRHMSGPDSRHRQAVLACQMSVDALNEGAQEEAGKQARIALDLDDDFLPAALVLARFYVETGKARKAGALIERHWERHPHPSLVELYYASRGASTPLELVKAAEHLRGFNPAHPESSLAVARAALGADLWGQARKHLLAAGGETPSARVCRLMADLEEAENADAASARQWLVRASLADPDPAWVCSSCGHAVKDWRADCANCHDFDTLAWGAPPHVLRLEETASDANSTGSGAQGRHAPAYLEHADYDGGGSGAAAVVKQPMPAEG